MPTIRVDTDVYKWLQDLATPFEDNPNSVLRRVASLGNSSSKPSVEVADEDRSKMRITSYDTNQRLTARLLCKRFGVQVEHALYHRDGKFYENLKRFPGALFDPHGYVIFNSEDEYRSSPYLRISQKLNVPGGVDSIPGYVHKG